jgi:hypothetical protein
MQTIKLTKGQEGACNGGFAKCRAEGGQHIHFYWNADIINWGWSGLLPANSSIVNFTLEELNAGFEIQFTDVDPAVVPNIWEQDDTGDIINPYERHVEKVSIGWVFSCYDVDAVDYGCKIWLRIRGVGMPYWYMPYDEDTVYGDWTDPAIGWVQGHEADTGWEPDYPLRITNYGVCLILIQAYRCNFGCRRSHTTATQAKTFTEKFRKRLPGPRRDQATTRKQN